MSTSGIVRHTDDPHRRVEGLLPTAAALIKAFDGDIDPDQAEHPVVRVAEALSSQHRRQWAAEDDSRTATDPNDVARSKRLINELNAGRVGMVEQIDQWAVAEISTRLAASLHTETLGSVIDRLAIGWVRANQPGITSGDRQWAGEALRQVAELADAYDDLVRDLARGRRRLPAWRSLKRYGPTRQAGTTAPDEPIRHDRPRESATQSHGGIDDGSTDS